MTGPLKLLIRTFALFVVASLPLVISYAIVDPLKCLRYHDDYFNRGTQFCKGMVSTSQFKHQYPLHHYNSYILGSSISCYYPIDDWLHYLPTGARAFHFDSSGQPISYLRKSLEFIDRNSDDLDNVLIVLSTETLEAAPGPGLIYTLPPEVLGSATFLKYHWDSFTEALNHQFLDGYVNHQILHKTLTRPNRYPVSKQPVVYNATTNEESMPEWNEILANRPADFLEIYDFYDECRPKTITRSAHSMPSSTIAHLQAIADVLERRGSDYRVVFAPNTRHEDVSAADDHTLRRIFGDHYVNLIAELDSMTQQQYFYDSRHYTPALAREVLRRAYSQR
jgi:hypothetical protein